MPHLAVLKKNSYLFLVVLVAAFGSCERYDFASDSSVTLQFSTDTVSFDTIFAPIGSTTFSCKIYNNSNKNIIIDEVYLVKRGTSPFLMNVDGHAGYSVRNIRLAKKDSLYIMLEVQRNATLLLTDEIAFVMGGVEQQSRMELVAYGQEVVLFDKDTTLRSDYTFTPDKPYLITGNITIDKNITATVEAGAKLYFGWKCGMIVNGTLLADGHVTNRCVFSHPRYKDPWYSTASGQWQGITVNASGTAQVTYALLHGARYGFYVLDTLDEAGANYPQLQLSKSIVEYSEIGVNISKGSATMNNTLVVNSITNALLMQGGNYEGFQSTFATYATPLGYHGTQVVLQNFRVRAAKDTVNAPLALAHFGNDIIYGSNSSELAIRQRAGVNMNYTFEYCTIKSKGNLNNFFFVKPDDPKFKDVSKNDFHLSTGSPAINSGRKSIAIDDPGNMIDLDGYNRAVEQDSSMGCYVYHPSQQ